MLARTALALVLVTVQREWRRRAAPLRVPPRLSRLPARSCALDCVCEHQPRRHLLRLVPEHPRAGYRFLIVVILCEDPAEPALGDSQPRGDGSHNPHATDQSRKNLRRPLFAENTESRQRSG
jgi:hypothetical protein